MPMLGLAQKLCLNEHVVPLHRVTMDIADPHKLTQEGDTERQDLCLVDVSPNGPSYWLEKGFNLSTRWWRSNSSNLPLLAEIRDAIISGKPSGPQARMPRRPNIVVAVKVRGQVILVQNSHKKLQLALPHGKEESLLSWFLEQLIGEVDAFTRKKGTSHPQNPRALRRPSRSVPPRPEKTSVGGNATDAKPRPSSSAS